MCVLKTLIKKRAPNRSVLTRTNNELNDLGEVDEEVEIRINILIEQ